MPAPRTPSIRDLRRSRPDNVVILPTAASRQVHGSYSAAAREARKALRERHAARFRHKWPGQREAERRADALRSADAGAVLAIAILAELDLETRRRVIARLAGTAHKGPAYRQAADLAAITALNLGEEWDLLKALEALYERAE